MSLSALAAKNLLRNPPQEKKDTKDIPADFGKMPANYDFSTRRTNWAEFHNDFLLRTDAVWEKQKLLDGFRLYQKCFYFDKVAKKYVVVEPDDIYTLLLEPWALEDINPFPGFTPTGRTNSFQPGLGPKQRVVVPAQTNFIHADFYDLCAMRFEKWWRCDMVYYDQRDTKYDYRVDQENYKAYPCFREFYEANYACQDDLFDFLMELHYAKQANDWFPEDAHNYEMMLFPTTYDAPKPGNNEVLTY